MTTSSAVRGRAAAARVGACTQLLLSLCLAAMPLVAGAAPKTDVVTLINGDRYTGEIKGLEQGKLKLKTDAAGTIYIEWNKIASLKTNQYLQVELEGGQKFLGQVPKAGEAGAMRVVDDPDAGEPRDVALEHVVRISPIERGKPLSRLDGYVTAGYNYTKANELQQMTFTGGLSSRTEERKWALDGSSTLTSQQGNDDSSRWSLGGEWWQFLQDRWFVLGFGGFESNNELALDLRTMAGAAGGRYLMQTTRQEWSTYAGLAYTNEKYAGEEQLDSLEALFGTQYSYFRYDSPEASLEAILNLYPSLTQSGRVRAEAQLYSRYEIVKDLFFEISVYGSYDNQPGDQALSDSDYGLTTSLGYSF
jgi:hypothetical protein